MPHDDVLSVGRQTINAEADALSLLANSLDQDFVRAVEKLYHAKSHLGRIMVCGVGKSGHIGKKIAATLASTGSPAYFVHPAEAAHGDMGMITANDVLLMLSKSGESSEFQLVLEYAKRHGIPIIAVTCRRASTLGKFAQVVLQLPTPKESPSTDTAAPTNSTTMTLALGDALAMALLKLQGFSREDFAKLHPGGQLGAQLSSVSTVMHTAEAMPLVSDQASMKDALIEMTDKRLGCVGLIDQQQRLCGIITDGDLRRHLSENPNLLDAVAGDVGNTEPCTIAPDMLCAEAINLMEDNKITVLFVLEAEKLVGIIHLHDLLSGKVR